MKTTKTKTNRKSKAKERKIIGLDPGDRRHEVCVLARGGDVVWRGKIANTREAMAALSRAHRGGLVVMEVGMNSPWISRHFESLGHRVVVANPRKVRAIHQNKSEHPTPFPVGTFRLHSGFAIAYSTCHGHPLPFQRMRVLMCSPE